MLKKSTSGASAGARSAALAEPDAPPAQERVLLRRHRQVWQRLVATDVHDADQHRVGAMAARAWR